jgi:hypothetical protein
MSIEVNNIGRLIVINESTFGAELSSSIVGSGKTIPAVEGSISMELTQESIDPKALTAYKDKKLENVLGLRRAKLSFQVPAISPGATTSGNPHTQNPLGFLLSYVMGGELLGEGHDTTWSNAFAYTAGGTAASHVLDEGGAVGVPITGGITWRSIDAATGSTITLKHRVIPAGTTPSNGTNYGCSTYYLTEDPSTSLQFAVFGAEADDRWLLVGGQLESMSISTEMGQIPMFNFTFQFANWYHGNDNATLPSSLQVANDLTGTLAAYSYTGNNYIVNTGGEFLFIATDQETPSSGTTYRLPISSDTYNCALTYTMVPSPSGTQGVSRFVRASVKPVMSGSFNIPYEDVKMFNYKHSATAEQRRIQLWRVIGGTAGGTMIIDCGTVQVTNIQRVDDNGLAYQTVSWEARHDEIAGTSAATGLGTSAFRIHFG